MLSGSVRCRNRQAEYNGQRRMCWIQYHLVVSERICHKCLDIDGHVNTLAALKKKKTPE